MQVHRMTGKGAPPAPRQAITRAATGVTIGVAILPALLTPVPLQGQIHRSPPPPGATTHTVVPGSRYEASGLRSWFFGSGFRDIWASPVEVEVLDLDREIGGLTVTETGGYGQTFTLEFRGRDGLDYAVRSLDKDPTRRMDPLLRNTLVADIVQDQTSSFLPTAGLVVDPLLAAAGILYPKHKLVVVPDDPRLGEFRKDYAGLIGMFVERPQEGPDGTPGFAGSTRISGTDTFLEELEEAECDRADAREYLKARFIDMLVGDRDRHEGQWRWARYPSGSGGASSPGEASDEQCHVWRPIPEDRDQAFIYPDGVMMAFYRRIDYRMVKFGPEYPSLHGLTFNGWELDRRLLSGFDEVVWVEVAEELKSELTDAVIEDAVRRLPEPHYSEVGEWLTRSLKTRRDALTEEVLDFYRLISREVEITATDRDERAVFEHLPGGGLTLAVAFADGDEQSPYFHRIFDPSVTDEVRLFLRGGDDRVEIRGDKGDIRVRAIGGGGDDAFVNSSHATRSRTRIYDARGDNRYEGRIKLDESDFQRPPASNLVHRHALDWGSIQRQVPFVAYSPDVGAQLGLVWSMDQYGFRKVPWFSRNTFQVSMATNDFEPFITWDGRFRKVLGQADIVTHVEYSGINILRFYGFGNGLGFRSNGIDWPPDLIVPHDDEDFYEVQQRELIVAPSIEFTFGHDVSDEEEAVTQFRPNVRAGFGPILKYSDTPLDDNADSYIGMVSEKPLGMGGFGQLGVRGWLDLDWRDNMGYPTSGFQIFASASAFPTLWDVDDAFGEIHGIVSGYLTPGSGARAPTLALRAGGKAVFGTYPFHEAAYIGGRNDLRGFRQERFAGDASLFGNAELRMPLAGFRLVFPAEFGVSWAADAGRVFFEDDVEDADDWHTAVGGGLWISFMNRLQTLSLSVMGGDDMTALYLRAGMHF